MSQAMDDKLDMSAVRYSGEGQFSSIDMKLGAALSKCLESAPDSARTLKYEVRELSHQRVKRMDLVRGRELTVMILKHFAASGHDESLFMVRHIHELAYPGDKDLAGFWATWCEILANLRPDDKQSDATLRDWLYEQIKKSNEMSLGIAQYEMFTMDHPSRTLKYLEDLIKITLDRIQRNKNKIEKEKFVRDLTRQGARNAAAASKDEEKDGPKNDKAGPKAKAAPAAKAEAKNPGKDKEAKAIPIIPHGAQKEHSKGEGRAKRREMGRRIREGILQDQARVRKIGPVTSTSSEEDVRGEVTVNLATRRGFTMLGRRKGEGRDQPLEHRQHHRDPEQWRQSIITET